jgi:thioredoxin reductase (NADPH)
MEAGWGARRKDVLNSNDGRQRVTKGGLKTAPQMEAVIVERKRGLDLVIIGGGPAGLSAGIFAMRMGLNTVLIEKALPGGQMSATDRIENYPGFPKEVRGMELSDAFKKHAQNLGLEIVWGTVSKVETAGKEKRVIYDDTVIEAKAIIIATGTEPKKLGIPGEKEFLGRGVSYCATCDAPFYKDKKIVVVGGGNAALEEAIFLANFAGSVTVIHRRDELRADKIFELRARNNPKIYFVWDSVIEKIEGKDKVGSITVRNTKTKKSTKIAAEGIFMYVGSTPNTSLFDGKIKKDGKGFVITDEEMQTSVKGVFAAGDVRAKHLRQIVTATSDGAIATSTARKYIEGSKS